MTWEDSQDYSRQRSRNEDPYLSDTQKRYYGQLLGVLKQGFESNEDKIIFAENVLEQTSGEEIIAAANIVASQVLEFALGFAGPALFERFANKLFEDIRKACSDRIASHVLQKTIHICSIRGTQKLNPPPPAESAKSKRPKYGSAPEEVRFDETSSYPPEHTEYCLQFVIKASKFFMNNLEEYVEDPYANYIIRACLHTLCGLPPYCSKTKFPSMDHLRQVPDEWSEIAKEYGNRLGSWPQLVDLPFSALTSGLLQALVIVLSLVDKSTLKSLGKKILGPPSADDEAIPKLLEFDASTRLIESLLHVAGPKLFRKLYTRLFKGHLVYLAKKASANFAVQELINSSMDATDFESIFQELQPAIDDILRVGHFGVVHALAKTCNRLASQQKQFIMALKLILLKTEEGAATQTPKQMLCLAIMNLKLPPSVPAGEEKCVLSLHGSLILQELLHFSKPIEIVDSLLELPPHQLVGVFCDPKGSFIADAFCKSKGIGEKSRTRLVYYLKDNFITLASSKCGSRALEAIFQASKDKQKAVIVEELSKKINLLESSQFGKILSMKWRVKMYKTNVNQWTVIFCDKSEVAGQNNKRKAEK